MQSVAACFRRNLPGFWSSCRWCLIIYILAQLCDTLSTCYFMNQIGWEYEFHPVVRYAGYLFGPTAGPLLSFAAKVVFGTLVAVYLRPYAKLIFLTAAATATFAAYYNMRISLIHHPYRFYDLLASLGF